MKRHRDAITISDGACNPKAIINSMVAAEDMSGYRGVSAKALPQDKLMEIMRQYNRLDTGG